MLTSMDTNLKWIIVRVDGKIASISTDYKALARVAGHLASPDFNGKPRRKGKVPSDAGSHVAPVYENVSATTCSLEDLLKLKNEAGWDDLMLFGTDFQKRVWRKLWDLTHDTLHKEQPEARLLSYSDFAETCDNRAGVRAVAHAVGLNPVPIIIPCHLIIPKETIDKIAGIRKKAESTIFKGEDLCLSSILNDSAIDFGEYALGKELKRQLISLDLE